MVAHRISVTVEPQAIRVEPETLVMTSDDEVQWVTANAREFSIVFDSDTPFGQRELAHAVARERQRPRVKGRFKYTVVSSDDPNLVLDPVIIISDPPSRTDP